MTGYRVFISYGGPDRKIRDEAGKEYLFEDHPRFGPMLTNKAGDILDKQPGERAPFWKVYQWWSDQGKKIDADGFAVWAKPPEPKLTHLGGRHYRAEYPATETTKDKP